MKTFTTYEPVQGMSLCKKKPILVKCKQINEPFEIITMEMASLTEISREGTDKESIKKQTSVLIFGSSQDTYHWTADKVMIVRWK